jgi:hypothetical protein
MRRVGGRRFRSVTVQTDAELVAQAALPGGMPTASAIHVVAGLDPAIHPPAKKIDPRVKPAGDG